ncbi:MAG: hypothetical protein AB1374_04570 [Bacillota bacterium]
MFFDDALQSLSAHLRSLPHQGRVASSLPYKAQPDSAWSKTIAQGQTGSYFWRVEEITDYFKGKPFRVYWLLGFYTRADRLPPWLLVRITYATWVDALLQHPGFSYWKVGKNGAWEVRDEEKLIIPGSRKFLHSLHWENIEPFGYAPTILLCRSTVKEEIAAQLCLHALRSNFPLSESETAQVFDYLRRFVELRVRNQDVALDLVNKMVYGSAFDKRPLTARSFSSYLRGVVAALRRKRVKEAGTVTRLALEEGQRDVKRRNARRRQAEVRKFYRVDDVAVMLDVDRKWLYRRIKEGKITAHVKLVKNSVSGSTGAIGEVTRKEYFLDTTAVEQARRTADAQKADRALVKFVATHRGLSENAARMWVRRRQKKGISLEDILQELGVSPL